MVFPIPFQFEILTTDEYVAGSRDNDAYGPGRTTYTVKRYLIINGDK